MVTDRQFLDRVGALLASTGADIERLGMILCADPAVCVNHMDVLQDIDRIAQVQRSLAALFLAADPVSAVDKVELDLVRSALQAPAVRVEPRISAVQ